MMMELDIVVVVVEQEVVESTVVDCDRHQLLLQHVDSSMKKMKMKTQKHEDVLAELSS